MELGVALHLAGRALLVLALPMALVVGLAAAAGILLQTGFLVNLSAIAPDFSRISPLSGLKRVFGTHHMMEAAKSILKVAVVGFAGWSALSGALPQVMAALNWTPGRLVEQLWAQLATALVAMLGAYGLFTVFDVLKTRHSFFAGLKMTKQEQRDEMKDADGDPHIKAKQKQIRMQRARRRMMADVPKATVVVTNPTHYAVALLYDRANGGAPRIVAKGMDEVAARIRAVAEESGVPLVANPPLARALYPMKLGSEIPQEHFKAVAELIAYVWRLKAPAARPAA
jgi:flagellar biosynthetic protein FlhB